MIANDRLVVSSCGVDIITISSFNSCYMVLLKMTCYANFICGVGGYRVTSFVKKILCQK